MAATVTPAPAPVDTPDFAHRLDPALLPELMDEPCAYEEFRDCVRDIAATTRLTRAYGPTLDFVAEVLRQTPRDQPTHIVDVGSGGGDTLRHIARWAQRQGRAVRLTGIDLNPHATRAARELCGGDPRYAAIEWRTGDVFVDPATRAPDVILSSLVTHHMPDREIVRFLGWMEVQARLGWFISDLIRSARAYQLFRVISRVMRWHPFVQNDGLVSIRRAFREPDWAALLAAADVSLDDVRLERRAIGRLCVSRIR